MELWDHLPRTEDSLRCVAVLAVTLSIGGCFGGGGIGRLSIKGYVTEIDTTNFERFVAGLRYSSPSVQGATVAITGTGHVATTNSRGEFTFYDVPPGVYNVMVMKDGWASSAAYNVMAMSTTVHYSVFDLTVELGERGLLSQSVSTVNETYGMPRHLQMIESGVRPLAMPAGSDAAIYCDVLWNNNDPTVKGFKVYRDGIFIGQLPASESESESLLRHQLMQEPFVARVSKSFPVDLVTIWSHRHNGQKKPRPGWATHWAGARGTASFSRPFSIPAIAPPCFRPCPSAGPVERGRKCSG
jgi:hypothetical protein